MKTTLLTVLTSLALLAGSLTACGPTPPPDRPRRRAAPPPPPPRRDPPPRKATQPPARKPPHCLLRSADKSLCLVMESSVSPRCRRRHCRHRRQYRVVKLDGTLLYELPVFRVGKPLYLSNAGVLVTDLRHSITSPTAVVVMVYTPTKRYALQAKDLLAPSRFITEGAHKKKIVGHTVEIAVPGGKPAVFDFETQTVKQADVHCQTFGKRHVLISKPTFQKPGTFMVATGTCPSHRVLWSMESDEAPVALTRNARRVVTRNSLYSFGGARHIATVYERKGKAGVVKAHLGLRDLTTVKERVGPQKCGMRCRMSIRFEFAVGGKLKINFPSGTKKTVDLTRPALLRKKRVRYRFGIDKATKRAFFGDPRAKATILVYGGVQCPFTARFMLALQDLLSVQNRGVKVLFADYPIRYHRMAIPAASAARSVLAQKGAKAYWQFMDLAFASGRRITVEKLLAWAKQVGANPAKVKADLDAKKYDAAIQADVVKGKQMGVRGTPSAYINGQVVAHRGRTFWGMRELLKPILRRLKPVR